MRLARFCGLRSIRRGHTISRPRGGAPPGPAWRAGRGRAGRFPAPRPARARSPTPPAAAHPGHAAALDTSRQLGGDSRWRGRRDAGGRSSVRSQRREAVVQAAVLEGVARKFVGRREFAVAAGRGIGLEELAVPVAREWPSAGRCRRQSRRARRRRCRGGRVRGDRCVRSPARAHSRAVRPTGPSGLRRRSAAAPKARRRTRTARRASASSMAMPSQTARES